MSYGIADRVMLGAGVSPDCTSLGFTQLFDMASRGLPDVLTAALWYLRQVQERAGMCGFADSVRLRITIQCGQCGYVETGSAAACDHTVEGTVLQSGEFCLAQRAHGVIWHT
jgi:hypothetical protein